MSNLYLVKSSSNYEASYMSFYTPRQLYSIEDKIHATFLKTYCIETNSDKKNKLGEVIGSHLPIICDCSFLFQSPIEMEDEFDNFVILLVNTYQNIIKENFNISENSSELRCCVLKNIKNEFIDNDSVEVFRLRLIFPFCRTTQLVQDNLIIKKVISSLRLRKIVSIFPSEPLNNWEDVFSLLTTKTAISLYGSVDNPSNSKLELVKIYENISDNLLSIDNVVNNENFSIENFELKMNNVFDIINSSFVRKRIIPIDLFGDDKNSEIYLPLFLSINNYWDGITCLREDIEIIEDSQKKVKNYVPNINTDNMTEQDMAKMFLSMIDKKRFSESIYWIDIGKCLYNIFSRSPEGLTIWKSISDNEIVKKCEFLYYTFRDDNSLNLKTLAWYAKKDNHEKYNDWHSKWTKDAMTLALDLTHSSIATALFRLYWLDISCKSVQSKSLYLWKSKSHYWIQMDKDSQLRLIISGDFRNRFIEYRTELSEESGKCKNSDYSLIIEKRIEIIGVLIKKLGNSSFKEQIVKESIDFFKDEMFEKYENKLPELKACYNGVIEVDDKKAIFRDGKPQDYLTKCSQIFYDTKLTWKSPDVVNFMNWMEDVFHDEELKLFFIKLLASCLYSRNVSKVFVIFTGVGNNGKSMIKILTQCMFGSYCVDIPVTAITQKRPKSSAPEPELVQADGASIAWMDEPDDNKDIKKGNLKSFTGGDTRFVRDLNKSGGTIKQTFTLFLQCNGIPIISGADEASINRTLIVPCLSKWVNYKDCPSDIIEQKKKRLFPIDLLFDKKIPQLAVAGLWVIVQYYSLFKKEGLKRPLVVIEYTKKYWEENDIYKMFQDECIEQSIDSSTGEHNKNVKLNTSEIYSAFKIWYSDQYPKQTIPNAKIVKESLSKRWGNPLVGGWTGIQFKQNIVNFN